MTQRHLFFCLVSLSSILVLSTESPGGVLIFSDDFTGGKSAEFTGAGTTVKVQDFDGYGPISNPIDGDFLRNNVQDPSLRTTTLTLTGLQAHTSIELNFLLAVIDSWDGNGSGDGPDAFNVTVDGVSVFSEVFENSTGGTQSYNPPTGGELVRHQQLGFNEGLLYFTDSAYNMGLDSDFDAIVHTASTLTIEWFASGPVWQGGEDESWAIDNVEVILNGTVPEPAALVVWLAVGLLGLGSITQTKRRVQSKLS